MASDDDWDSEDHSGKEMDALGNYLVPFSPIEEPGHGADLVDEPASSSLAPLPSCQEFLVPGIGTVAPDEPNQFWDDPKAWTKSSCRWVACSQCSKWRRFPLLEDISENWTCSLNKNERFASCTAKQEMEYDAILQQVKAVNKKVAVSKLCFYRNDSMSSRRYPGSRQAPANPEPPAAASECNRKKRKWSKSPSGSSLPARAQENMEADIEIGSKAETQLEEGEVAMEEGEVAMEEGEVAMEEGGVDGRAKSASVNPSQGREAVSGAALNLMVGREIAKAVAMDLAGWSGRGQQVVLDELRSVSFWDAASEEKESASRQSERLVSDVVREEHHPHLLQEQQQHQEVKQKQQQEEEQEQVVQQKQKQQQQQQKPAVQQKQKKQQQEEEEEQVVQQKQQKQRQEEQEQVAQQKQQHQQQPVVQQKQQKQQQEEQVQVVQQKQQQQLAVVLEKQQEELVVQQQQEDDHEEQEQDVQQKEKEEQQKGQEQVQQQQQQQEKHQHQKKVQQQEEQQVQQEHQKLQQRKLPLEQQQSSDWLNTIDVWDGLHGDSKATGGYSRHPMDTGSPISCSSRICKAAEHHLAFLDPPAVTFPLTGWLCSTCLKKKQEHGPHEVFPAAQSLLGYSPLGLNPRMDKADPDSLYLPCLDSDILWHSERSQSSRGAGGSHGFDTSEGSWFLVRWKGFSHLHDSWMRAPWVSEKFPSLVALLSDRLAGKTKKAAPWRRWWRQPERVIARRALVPAGTDLDGWDPHGAQGDGQLATWDLLVKWKGLEYSEATWESFSQPIFSHVGGVLSWNELANLGKEDPCLTVGSHHTAAMEWLLSKKAESCQAVLAEASGMGKILSLSLFLGRVGCVSDLPAVVITSDDRLGHWRRALAAHNSIVLSGSPNNCQLAALWELHGSPTHPSMKIVLVTFDSLHLVLQTLQPMQWQVIILDCSPLDIITEHSLESLATAVDRSRAMDTSFRLAVGRRFFLNHSHSCRLIHAFLFPLLPMPDRRVAYEALKSKSLTRDGTLSEAHPSLPTWNRVDVPLQCSQQQILHCRTILEQNRSLIQSDMLGARLPLVVDQLQKRLDCPYSSDDRSWRSSVGADMAAFAEASVKVKPLRGLLRYNNSTSKPFLIVTPEEMVPTVEWYLSHFSYANMAVLCTLSSLTHLFLLHSPDIIVFLHIVWDFEALLQGLLRSLPAEHTHPRSIKLFRYYIQGSIQELAVKLPAPLTAAMARILSWGGLPLPAATATAAAISLGHSSQRSMCLKLCQALLRWCLAHPHGSLGPLKADHSVKGFEKVFRDLAAHWLSPTLPHPRHDLLPPGTSHAPPPVHRQESDAPSENSPLPAVGDLEGCAPVGNGVMPAVTEPENVLQESRLSPAVASLEKRISSEDQTLPAVTNTESNIPPDAHHPPAVVSLKNSIPDEDPHLPAAIPPGIEPPSSQTLPEPAGMEAREDGQLAPASIPESMAARPQQEQVVQQQQQQQEEEEEEAALLPPLPVDEDIIGMEMAAADIEEICSVLQLQDEMLSTVAAMAPAVFSHSTVVKGRALIPAIVLVLSWLAAENIHGSSSSPDHSLLLLQSRYDVDHSIQTLTLFKEAIAKEFFSQDKTPPPAYTPFASTPAVPSAAPPASVYAAPPVAPPASVSAPPPVAPPASVSAAPPASAPTASPVAAVEVQPAGQVEEASNGPSSLTMAPAESAEHPASSDMEIDTIDEVADAGRDHGSEQESAGPAAMAPSVSCTVQAMQSADAASSAAGTSQMEAMAETEVVNREGVRAERGDGGSAEQVQEGAVAGQVAGNGAERGAAAMAEGSSTAATAGSGFQFRDKNSFLLFYQNLRKQNRSHDPLTVESLFLRVQHQEKAPTLKNNEEKERALLLQQSDNEIRRLELEIAELQRRLEAEKEKRREVEEQPSMVDEESNSRIRSVELQVCLAHVMKEKVTIPTAVLSSRVQQSGLPHGQPVGQPQAARRFQVPAVQLPARSSLSSAIAAFSGSKNPGPVMQAPLVQPSVAVNGVGLRSTGDGSQEGARRS